jgi:hypothetical protein
MCTYKWPRRRRRRPRRRRRAFSSRTPNFIFAHSFFYLACMVQYNNSLSSLI